MVCENCQKREAVIHVQEHSPSGVRTVRLCLECAAVKGLNIRSQDVESLFSSFISNLFTHKEGNALQIDSLKLLNLQCPTCGRKLNDIVEDQIVGCAYCYNDFGQIIETIISSYNNSFNYKGHLPEDIERDRSYKLNLLRLKKQLRQSVKKEDYSKAVNLRDKIKVLKKKHKTGISD